jgi:hypothetical protein
LKTGLGVGAFRFLLLILVKIWELKGGKKQIFIKDMSKCHFTLTVISLESERNAFSADVYEWFLVLDWIIHQRVPWEQNIRYIYLPSLQLSIIMWLSHLLTSFSSQRIRYLFPKNRVTFDVHPEGSVMDIHRGI